ncbi:MAG: hypothetical protein MJ233_03440 [Mycoplasmoidaceae bacterium]|nr:hypothetical protein [Mycoplasmoidaceae bacterium]
MQHFYGRSSFIGLERTVDVTIGTKRSYKVRVVGQQEDYNAETGKQVALTFEFENTLTNTNGISLKFKYSDSSSVSSSRWGESKVREEINHLSSAMDQTVAQAAKIVQKQTYNGISSSIKPSLTRDKFFLPSLFEYFSMKGLTSGLVYEGIKHFIEYGGGKIESPQYSYYRQKVGDQSPNDLYEQFYRYPIVDEQGVIPLPNSY